MKVPSHPFEPEPAEDLGHRRDRVGSGCADPRKEVDIHALAPQSSLGTEGGCDQLSSQQRPWINPSPG